ncbi:Endonuclease/exonuclease/phosphatase [Flammula alnicola]|nr:Endonuclease/exonuclease/phosphatase [Flammula alnicola]
MAPSRTSSKRKIDSDDAQSDRDEGPSQSSQSSKKPRREKASPPQSTQPTNKVLPVNIVIPPKQTGTTRVVAWNVSGFAASSKKGFSHYVEAEDADILIITETKLQQAPANPSLKTRYPHQYWSSAAKKGYAGTAILSKHAPLSVKETIPGHPDPESVKGRIVTLEFETCYLVGTYVVNAGQGLKTMAEKNLWNTHFFAYMRDLDKTKPVIWAGDLNVAPTELDLSNAKSNWNKTAGYTESETTAFKHFLASPDDPDANKFVDVWRAFHPDQRAYSYFSYRFNCRAKGIGWRIDGVVMSQRLQERIKMCEIRDEIYGASDHCPVVVEIDGTL